jgi:hypothetical protein
VTTAWAALLVTAAGCYALKLLGLAAPKRLLEHPLASRVSALLPAALLAALLVVQTLATGTRLVVDARVVGIAAAVVAVLLRAPFLVVVAVAAGAAAAVRLLG